MTSRSWWVSGFDAEVRRLWIVCLLGTDEKVVQRKAERWASQCGLAPATTFKIDLIAAVPTPTVLAGEKS